MAREIDRKLRLTAALLGVTARKDLAAAFRRVNANTTFDVARADKWLHGRAQPREAKLYEDWSKVLGLDRTGSWISDCAFEEFLAEVAVRHERDPEELRRRLDASARGSAREAPGLSLAGTYASYSHAWSPYFRGQLLRGELTIGTSGRADRPVARYAEILPTGRLQLDGAVAVDKRALRVEVCDETQASQYVNFSLFPPSPPVSVLAGLMFGTTLIGPDAQPSVTRAVLVRLPGPGTRLGSQESYMPAGASIARDLVELGLKIDAPEAIDRALASFMAGGGRNGIDQVSGASYRELLELFDRQWLTRGSAISADDEDKVRPFPRRTAKAGR